jgi:hypothetical protein
MVTMRQQPALVRHHERFSALMMICCAALALSACNDHELIPFNVAVQSSIYQKTNQIKTRPVDIVFLVDNSNSMCEEQTSLVKNFNAFIDHLVDEGTNFQIAVITTDATEAVPGAFRTRPGTYNAPGCAAPPNTADCSSRQLPADGVLKVTDYRGKDNFKDIIRDDFRCLALTGIDGNGVEMGLETVRQALLRGKSSGFLRPDAFLAIVFVTDENDCSDGTLGITQAGPVYDSIKKANGVDSACEFQRNIEDSCMLTSKNAIPISHTYTNAAGEEVTELRTGLEWCTLGNRDVVEALKDQLDINCPEGGCTNGLLKRSEFYEFLTGTEAQSGLGFKPEDIIIASIINQDSGERFSEADVPAGKRIPPACGRVDTLGYRYELFTRMFPDTQQVTGAICEGGKPTDFAAGLSLIATTIGQALRHVCLKGQPAGCTADGVGEGHCLDGEICCPGLQLCGRRAEAVDCVGLSEGACDQLKRDNKRVYYEGTEFEYRLCSGFRVVVGEEIEGEFKALTEGVDFAIQYEDVEYCGRGTPMGISFSVAPSEGIVVTFPQSLQKGF